MGDSSQCLSVSLVMLSGDESLLTQFVPSAVHSVLSTSEVMAGIQGPVLSTSHFLVSSQLARELVSRKSWPVKAKLVDLDLCPDIPRDLILREGALESDISDVPLT